MNNEMKNLPEIQIYTDDLQTEWQELIEDFKEAQEDAKNGNLFSNIYLLCQCDLLRTTIYVLQKEVQDTIKNLNRFQKQNPEHQHLSLIESTHSQIKDLKKRMQKKNDEIEDFYPSLADDVLRDAQDLIAKFADQIEREKVTPSLKADLNQNLDKENFLQELMDALDAWREAREEFIEETEPEKDIIISEIDSALTACESTLLLKEIQD